MNESSLPIYEIESAFCDTLRKQNACVVTAPTGSGKSTQIPQWLLKELPPERKVLILQPRRLAARMLAERVAWELGGKLGEAVGFVTRFDRAVSAQTRLLFVTEGILTRMLLNPNELASYGAIVFDEFHERSLNADLGLAMARDLQQKQRPDLKLVVMSATLDAEAVSSYLDCCPVLASEGRLHPVDISYIRRTDLPNLFPAVAETLREAIESHPGDVLVFLPGVGEIRRCEEELRRHKYLEPLEILPLYGDLPPEAQRAVMNPATRRKVILATNIAETSLTIPGVRIVIDSGLVKQSRYDAVRGIDILETVPISRDSTQQRAGRAGREAPGICKRLWNALEQDHKIPHTPPEIVRVDLADALLAIHCAGWTNDEAFPWFQRPPDNSVKAARDLLHGLGLLDSVGTATDTGRAVLAFPAHPRIALLLWRSAQLGIYDLACGCAAILASRPLIAARSMPARQLTDLRGSLRKTKQNNSGQNTPESDFLAQFSLVQQAIAQHFSLDACERLGIQAGAARDIAREWADFRRFGSVSAAKGSLPTNSVSAGSASAGSVPAGSVPAGSAPAYSAPANSVPTGSVPVGSAPEGSVPVGSAPANSVPTGSVPVGSAPEGSVPAHYCAGNSPETTLARLLLECFPDRLARRLDKGTLSCELQHRRRATLSPRSLVRDEPFFIAAELRETSGSSTPGTTVELSLASGIREEWLWELFSDDLAEEDTIFWDGVKQQVLRRRTLSCRGLVLEESVRNDPPPDQAAALLAEQIESTNSLPLLGWDEKCTAWIDRVRFLRPHFPELELPEYTDDECRAIRQALCEGERTYAAVRNKPALPFLQAILTPKQLSAVERLAPAAVPLPRNRKMRIEYHPGQPPKGRARIQELYDVTGPLTVAAGRVPVLLDILAPNFRTVQITDDLPRFWQVHYPVIKPQLSRRYPKHEWR
ncbi:MAG: DEAD/DEAH box helicase [Victivallales bacterium]|nr:DEAD/DEAH box helicase [Victivallales bacterium]